MTDRRGRIWGALSVAAIAALFVLPTLGQRVITISHEARFALLARDMIERGVWFDAQIGGELYRNKPPLYPWSIVLFSLPRGQVTEATAQAPVALAAIAAVVFTFLLGQRLFGRRAGLWAALILVSSYDFFALSQLNVPDMLVVAFTAAAGYAFWRAVAEPPARGALVAFYASLALGVFAKGPVGLLPLLVGAVWIWTEHGPRGLGRLWSPSGIGLFAAVTGAWLGAFLASGSQSFVEKVLWTDWLAWYFSLPRWIDLKRLVVEGGIGFLPWTLVLPLPFAYLGRAWRSPSARFALLFFTVPVVLIALSHNSRARYLIPLYPAAALLIAWWADTQGAVRTRVGRALAGISLVVVLALVAAPGWVKASDVYYVAQYSWKSLPVIAAEMLVGVALFWGLWAGRPRRMIPVVAGAMLIVLAYGNWLYNDWVNHTRDFRGFAADLASQARGTDAAVFSGRRFYQIDFYLGRQLPWIKSLEEFNEYVARPERPVVAVNAHRWEEVQGRISPDLQVLQKTRMGEEDMFIVRRGPRN